MKTQKLISIEEIDAFIQKNSLAILYISQKECSVCHAVFPKLESLLMNYPRMQLAHVDAKEVEEIVGRFLVFSVPTIIIFHNEKELFREGRFVQFERLQARLEQINEYLDV